MTQNNKKPSFNSKTFKRLMGYITGGYKWRFIMVLVFIVISAAAGVAGSLFLQVLIDGYIEPLLLVENPVFTGLLKAVATMGLIYLVGVLCSYIYNLNMAIIGQNVQKNIRDEMFENMQKLPIKYFDTHSYGDVMSRYTNDIDTLRQMISQSIPNLVSAIVSITLISCAMIFTSIPLTLIVVVMVAMMFKVTGGIMSKSREYFVRQQKDLGNLNGYIEEMMNGQKVIKVFNYEAESKKAFDSKNEVLFESANNANQRSNILMPVLFNIMGIAYVLVAIAGGAIALNPTSTLTLGAIATFLQLTRTSRQPISQISQQASSIITALAGAERIFALMDEEPEVDNGYVTLVNAIKNEDGTLTETPNRTGVWAWKHPHSDGTLTYAEVKGDIVLEHVDFAYSEDKPVLNDISLFAKPGQKIAFVGATGAGKTTITNLINRFYDIADGKIRYDGININKIKKDDLRRSMGIVLQDTHLFTGTVMDNIRYGKLDATDEEIIAAAKLANADSFITRLPDGYNTVLSGDGSGLSQGQRQLLSIARAAVADPPVMILDEATSSIDTRTEKLVQSGMDALMEGRTVLVIAHRLSTIQNSKAIMVMEKGRIIERGNHYELIAQEGRYYQLYTGAQNSGDFDEETA